jgi:hypothetical protein
MSCCSAPMYCCIITVHIARRTRQPGTPQRPARTHSQRTESVTHGVTANRKCNGGAAACCGFLGLALLRVMEQHAARGHSDQLKPCGPSCGSCVLATSTRCWLFGVMHCLLLSGGARGGGGGPSQKYNHHCDGRCALPALSIPLVSQALTTSI